MHLPRVSHVHFHPEAICIELYMDSVYLPISHKMPEKNTREHEGWSVWEGESYSLIGTGLWKNFPHARAGPGMTMR